MVVDRLLPPGSIRGIYTEGDGYFHYCHFRTHGKPGPDQCEYSQGADYRSDYQHRGRGLRLARNGSLGLWSDYWIWSNGRWMVYCPVCQSPFQSSYGGLLCTDSLYPGCYL